MVGGRCRILVIEDDRETAEQLVEALATNGYEVDLAVDSDDGLEPRTFWRIRRYDNRSNASGY